MNVHVTLKGRMDQYNAKGKYDTESGILTVLKGSRVSETLNPSKTFSTNKVEKIRKNSVNGGTVKNDVDFKSASAAAIFVTGNSTNGLRVWKTQEGIPLKNYLQNL